MLITSSLFSGPWRFTPNSKTKMQVAKMLVLSYFLSKHSLYFQFFFSIIFIKLWIFFSAKNFLFMLIPTPVLHLTRDLGVVLVLCSYFDWQIISYDKVKSFGIYFFRFPAHGITKTKQKWRFLHYVFFCTRFVLAFYCS